MKNRHIVFTIIISMMCIFCGDGFALDNVVRKDEHGVNLIYRDANYRLLYYGEKDIDARHMLLPKSKYDEIRSWCINASHAGIISKLDCFKIAARLATVDERGDWGFSFNPDAFGFWREYSWAMHAAVAFYSIRDKIPNDPRVFALLVKPLIDLGVASPDEKMTIRLHDNKGLDKEQRESLVRIFRFAESEFASDSSLTAVEHMTGVSSMKERGTFIIEK